MGSGKSRMKTYMKFDTGSGALFDCRYDECRAMIEKGILQEVRRTEDIPAIWGGPTARSSVKPCGV